MDNKSVIELMKKASSEPPRIRVVAGLIHLLAETVSMRGNQEARLEATIRDIYGQITSMSNEDRNELRWRILSLIDTVLSDRENDVSFLVKR